MEKTKKHTHTVLIMFIDLLRHFCPGTGTTKLYAKRAPKAEAKAFTSVWGQSNQLKQLLQKASQLREVLLSFHFHDPAHVCVCESVFFLQQIMKCTLFTIAKLNRKIQWGQRATAALWMLAFGMWCIIHYTDDNILLVTRGRNRMQYGTKAPFPYYGNGKCFTLHW